MNNIQQQIENIYTKVNRQYTKSDNIQKYNRQYIQMEIDNIQKQIEYVQRTDTAQKGSYNETWHIQLDVNVID